MKKKHTAALLAAGLTMTGASVVAAQTKVGESVNSQPVVTKSASSILLHELLGKVDVESRVPSRMAAEVL
ncbi:MAG: hypothetical protein AAGK22_29820 [Acidobacteriota bacterium]